LAAVIAELGTIVDVLPEVCATLAARAHVRARAHEVAVAVLSGPTAIAEAAPAWRALEQVGGAATPFQTLAMASAVAPVHMQRGETPRIVVVRDGPRPILVFPTVTASRSGLSTIRFLGDPLIQYGDIVAAPEAEERHVAAAWQAVADPAVAQFIHLRKVREDSRVAPFLAAQTPALNRQAAPFVSLDQWQPQSVSANDLNRRRRRLSKHGELRFDVLSGPQSVETIRQALEMKRAWLDMRGLASRVIGCRKWESALLQLARQEGSGLRVARLQAGGKTAAIEIGFQHGATWCSFLGAMAPELAKAGPGHVQIAETLAHCQAEGHAVYDLLAPADAYKRAMATGSVQVRDHVAPLGARGHLAMLLVQSQPLLKRCADLLHPRLRAALMSMRGA
jgi:CelD/BcsL family acetyltransferase involved in cellulose biosynthesis